MPAGGPPAATPLSATDYRSPHATDDLERSTDPLAIMVEATGPHLEASDQQHIVRERQLLVPAVAVDQGSRDINHSFLRFLIAFLEAMGGHTPAAPALEFSGW